MRVARRSTDGAALWLQTGPRGTGPPRQVRGRTDAEKGSSSMSAESIPRLALTPSEVATACHLSKNLIYDAIRRNELGHTRHGRAIRVPIRALEMWIQTRTEGGVIEPSRRPR